MHHPPFLERADEHDDYFNLPRPNRERCLAMLRSQGVHHVLTGHLHRCHESSDQGLDVVVTGPVGMPLQDRYSGLRLVRIVEDKVQHEYFALNDERGQGGFVGQGGG